MNIIKLNFNFFLINFFTIFATMKNNNNRVCETHCCILHGCKYGDDDCPVCLGIIKQKFLCDLCRDNISRNSRNSSDIENANQPRELNANILGDHS